MIELYENIIEIYNYYDRPLTFICENDNKKFFVFWYDYLHDIDKWLVIPVDENEIEELNNGKIGLADFILKSENINLIHYDANTFVNEERITSDKLVMDYLPSEEMYIYNRRLYNVTRKMNYELLYKLLLQKYKNDATKNDSLMYEASSCENIHKNGDGFSFEFLLYNRNNKLYNINYYIKKIDNIENVNLRWDYSPYFIYLEFLRGLGYINKAEEYDKLIINVILECKTKEIYRLKDFMNIPNRVDRIMKYWSRKIGIEISIEYQSIYTLFEDNMNKITE